MNNRSLNGIYTPLWLCYGLVPIAAGADKFFNLLTDWSKYLPAIVTRVVPVSPHAFMMIVGVIEIIAGVVVLAVAPRLGAYVVAVWLVLIAVAVTMAGYYDIAVRDLVLAVGAITLGNIAALRGQRLLPFIGHSTPPAPTTSTRPAAA
jgi:hypothetical protein